MAAIPYALATFTGLLLGLLAGASPAGLAIFALMGLAGGAISATQARGSERVYWIALGLTVLFLFLAMTAFAVPGLVMVAPVTVAIGDFVARTVARLLGYRQPAA